LQSEGLDAGFDLGVVGPSIDGQNPIEPSKVEQNAAANGHGPTRQTRTTASRRKRDAFPVGQCDHGRNLGRRTGKNRDVGKTRNFEARSRVEPQ
jgi:hypothetical protein